MAQQFYINEHKLLLNIPHFILWLVAGRRVSEEEEGSGEQ